jgi:hypothetical protein
VGAAGQADVDDAYDDPWDTDRSALEGDFTVEMGEGGAQVQTMGMVRTRHPSRASRTPLAPNTALERSRE